MNDISTSDFLGQVFNTLKGFGGLGTPAIIAGVCTLVIASLKVSFLRQLVWDRLGWAKGLVAPLLGLVVGLFSLNSPTLGGLAAYALSGAGALMIHELLDVIKGIPGLGAVYVSIIQWIMDLLGARVAAPAVK